MAIGTQGKINELMVYKKTNGSIQDEYNNINYQYQHAKGIYKTSKVEYELAKEKLEVAQDKLKNAPLMKKINANKKVRTAKRILKLKRQKYLRDREIYKQKLKELKRLKSEIRSQYKSHRDYVKFFNNVKQAKKMGIKLPKYIEDEYAKQKLIYLSEKYEVDKSGERNYLTQPNTDYSKDVASLIREQNMQNVKDKLEKVVTRAKEFLDRD